MNTLDRNKLFKNLLSYFWLRPEKALLHTLKAEAFRKSLKYFKGKTADISCGDGMFSFFALGGELDIETDQYQSLKISKYKSVNVDVYDHYTSNYKIKIKKKPKLFYNFGTDYKKHLLSKAKHSKVYKKLIIHNNEKKFEKNFNSLNFIYSNSAYWVKNFSGHIKNLIEILNPDGTIALSLKTNQLVKSNIMLDLKPIFGNDFVNILDRERRNTWMGLKSLKFYKEFFKSQKNAYIDKIIPIYDNDILKIWDIGLRPIFEPLNLLSSNVTERNRVKAKKMMVDTFYNLFKSFMRNYTCRNNEAVEYLFLIKKK